MDAAGSPSSRAQELLAVIEPRMQPAAREWLVEAFPARGRPFARAQLFGHYAAASRCAGRLALGSDGRQALLDAGIAVPEAWSAADLARAVLLLGALDLRPADEHVGLATEAFRKGDSAERVGVLRALSLFPEPARFAELAIEACRTHVLDVFAAIACENPFPAPHFPQPSFNQLVMKALFLELALERVIGWRTRSNAELRRAAADYAAERRAAGRPVPPDVALIAATEDLP
jgi:hypothetical protein